MLLSSAEREQVIEILAAASRVAGRPLIVGAGNASTAQTIEAVRWLGERGDVAAALCLVPYYLRPTQAGIRAHFEAIAAASELPIVIYNIPARTGVRASAETLLELAQNPVFVGVKQS